MLLLCVAVWMLPVSLSSLCAHTHTLHLLLCFPTTARLPDFFCQSFFQICHLLPALRFKLLTSVTGIFGNETQEITANIAAFQPPPSSLANKFALGIFCCLLCLVSGAEFPQRFFYTDYPKTFQLSKMPRRAEQTNIQRQQPVWPCCG